VLEREGVRVLNPASALLAAHDKLAAARRFTDAGLAHPRTVPLTGGTENPPLPFPLVLKPRFGSWGRDVVLCADEGDFALALEELRQRPWLRSAGGVVQELVPPTGHDLRVIVSGGLAVGAIERVAAPGEWRTNVALGGARRPVDPPPGACELAVTAAVALGLDLAGVDLLPMPDGGHVVLEVNGASEFTPEYRRDADVFDLALRALLGASQDERARRRRRLAHPLRTG
jgi:RimK family alpha-L-glutamate ligase